MKKDVLFSWDRVWTDTLQVHALALEQLESASAGTGFPSPRGRRGAGNYLIRLRHHLSERARRRRGLDLVEE